MKRLLALGVTVLGGATAAAQTQISVYPGTVVRTRSAADATPATVLAPADAPVAYMPPPAYGPATVPAQAGQFDALQPLGGMLSRVLPTTPTVPAGTCATGNCGFPGHAPCEPACGAPLFPTARRGDCSGGDCGAGRPLGGRLLDWLTWHPAPSVLPLFTPNPHHAPLRAYFACPPARNPGYPSGTCAAGTCGGAAGGCGTCGAGGTALSRAMGLAGDDACAAPKQKGLGLFARPSHSTANSGTLDYSCGPVAVPLPAACVGYAAGCRTHTCGDGALSRVLRCFAPGHAGTPAVATPAYAADPTDWSPTWQGASPAPAAPAAPAPVNMPAAMPVPTVTGYHFADPVRRK